MCEQDLPQSLWEKDASTTVYIQNKIPHSALEEKSLEEVFNGRKPIVGHMRIFGSPVYIHIPKEKRKKWSPRERRIPFLGTVNSQNPIGSIF